MFEALALKVVEVLLAPARIAGAEEEVVIRLTVLKFRSRTLAIKSRGALKAEEDVSLNAGASYGPPAEEHVSPFVPFPSCRASRPDTGKDVVLVSVAVFVFDRSK